MMSRECERPDSEGCCKSCGDSVASAEIGNSVKFRSHNSYETDYWCVKVHIQKIAINEKSTNLHWTILWHSVFMFKVYGLDEEGHYRRNLEDWPLEYSCA